uniref:NADH-ubiquinone oxidoreductase chain 5 n=1 Tax=Aphrophora sp. EMHAU-2015-Zz062722 TaxID=2038649 RepID=A0A343K645_9HEMI|nr:NADH dehydrogenase subunit 5 [Aphrophora sp. EMHAU-2015-Zz062722]
MNKKFNLSLLVSILFMLMSMFFLLFCLYLINNDISFFFEFMLMSLNSVCIYMSMIFDWMSMIFLSFVLGISSIVIFYSGEYMNNDLNINRFIYLVTMFVLSMMFLIISPNMVSILLGWDGLGLVSYCLVIYYQNYKSFNAGMLTALMNRIGDVALLMCIAWMMNFGSWHYLFYLLKMNDLFMINLMIILASFTKSAQLPFSSWLPAAMAAPTPVSALVHSSTLVTAGVYLLIRFNLLIFNFVMIDFFIIMSILTMIMSGIGANFEFDLKKIIALSTLSQLGFMMSILMLGFPTMAFFHLLMHALFKALLFLCAGMVIHCMWGNQDIRYMGSLINQLPIISSCMNISNLALCGFPFLAGFYSKDLIMEYMLMSDTMLLYFIMFLISVGLTTCYSIRLTYYCLLNEPNLFSYLSIYDCSNKMKNSIIFMVIFSVIGGSSLSWMIFSSPCLIYLPIDLKIITILFVLIGGWIGYEINLYSKKIFNMYSELFFFFGLMWFMPMFSTFFFTNKTFITSLVYFKLIDQGWGELLGFSGLTKFFIDSSKINQFIQINNFKIYMLMFIIWMMFMFIFI